ncbi:cytochrome b/b6 domain-containing protein [Flavobacterium sp. LS1R10]|uniref:cytochrome b/b6 domain-containing protein n=1 Tax=Flavobacterium sp. LS1R10 TaxID=2497482 RepID=UPI000F84A53F|nr:cytochrome b/b6 domain-containing protein [Flavobacterium sp. LS1R10]RTY73211.1 cytochrome b/b6 domain-containing protein [Flavobacterium sp. LS1R10]
MKSRNYSTIYRIMHWSTAICMTLMLITIFLRMTWMNKNNVALIMQDYLSTTDQSLSQDQLILLAKKIRKPMWDWHIYIGYALVGLYSIRLALPFFGQMKFSNPFTKGLAFKEKIHYWTYLVFYACVAISLITGLIIVLGPENRKESMEDIHVLSIYYLLTFIVIHLASIFFSEFTNQQGLISRIISGSKKKN